MRLLLIRHALTPETGRRLSGRQPGRDLADSGRAQAARLAEMLAAVPLAAVVSSPLARCRQTAAPIAKAHGLRVLQRVAFAEVDFGEWTGRSLGSLRRTKAWGQLMETPSRFRFPGGETLDEARLRAVAGVEALVAGHPTQTVAVVAHADIIQCLLLHYLGLPVDAIHRLHVDPASLSILSLEATGAARVDRVNVPAGPWDPA